MHTDENDIIDNSVDIKSDDGIAEVPADDLDDADWDSSYEDEPSSQLHHVASSEEMADYDDLED